MKSIFVIGKSIGEARSIAEDIIEEQGETIVQHTSEEITTDKATYCSFAIFQSNNFRGHKPAEVYVIGDISAQDYTSIQSYFPKDTLVKVYGLTAQNSTSMKSTSKR